jgi:hypothetical protein
MSVNFSHVEDGYGSANTNIQHFLVPRRTSMFTLH